MRRDRRASAHVRVFRLLLRLFPAAFRGDFGTDMEADFADELRDAEGRRAATALWWRTFPSMIRTGVAERVAALGYDARFAARSMARTPGFTAAAVLMIALGTGANAAMFSVIDAVMLRSPFPDSDRLAIVLIRAAGRDSAAVSLDQYRRLAESSPALQSVGAMGSGQRPVLTGLGERRRLNVECVTTGIFAVLGTPPLAGRTFTADEDRPGGPGALVISYAFWQRDMQGAPDAVGRSVTLNGMPTTIVGIMPRGFGGPHSRNNNDGWLPLGPALGGSSTAGCNGGGAVNAFARVVPGLGLAAAAEQTTRSAGIDRIPDGQGRFGSTVTLVSLDEQTISGLRTPMLALVGAVGLVLLIASANVANLQLARVFARRREIGVRMAIGATRMRIATHALGETLVLYALGCGLGLVGAQWTLALLVALLPATIPHLHEISMNVRVLAVTCAVSCTVGLLAGLLPALHASSPSLLADLRSGAMSANRRGAGIRSVLVTAQIALSLTLLVGATLMIRTFLTLRPSSPGFTASDKVTALMRLQGPSAATPVSTFDAMFERLQAIPGVAGAAGSTYIPMSGLTSSAEVSVAGATIDVWTLGAVTPNYFAEMGIPITRGRAFDAHDDAGGAPVAIVNEAFVSRAWSTGSPIGQTIAVARTGGRTTRRVIGVIRDTRTLGSNLKVWPEVYVPFAQEPGPSLNLILRVGSTGDPRLPSAMRSAAAAVDATQVVDRFTRLQDVLDARVSTPRFGAWLLALFAAMALLLAGAGLAASIGWWVAQRTREIGVRMALGATPAAVTRMFLRQGLALGLIGVAVGLGGAAATTRLLESWLFGVTPLDLATFACSGAGILLIAAAASYVPARRAARVDPLVAIRTQ